MPAPAEILKLVERFAAQHHEYVSGSYNETQLRRDFLDPFLRALGWDVDNQAGNAEQYREVVHEDKVLVGGESKAPDYSCRIGGVRKFFIEAKKPGVDLKNDPKPAFQLRRYGWSARLPLSLLTDFEELAVYDTRLRPNQSDKAATARVLYLTYDEYAERWDEIAAIFSKEAVLKGSFDKYAEGKKGRKGTAAVDDEFLKEIEGWRELLAKDLAKANAKLSAEDLNFSVQRILDRIIFLRICEDRRIEDYAQLGALVNGSHIYGRLKELFDKADRRYNSGLFHFREEKERHESPDTVTPGLKVSDKALREIIEGLYYPAPWVFDVIPADILGHIYEQFLGKTIRLTAGHHVKVEEKPEVRKAGGVYYTPTYIVDYIVKETVGKLLDGKTPKEAAEIKILDPACGSGSFLIGAYQYLLDWHREWYVTDGPQKHPKELYEASKGDWRLATAVRKRILLNSIYGVDIDQQAVEVTKLSLLLKVLEGESGEALQRSFQLIHERVLPDLGENIRCGNSLLDPLEAGGLSLDLGGTWFDWETEFANVFRAGGFSAVIGNPPYLFITEVEPTLRPLYEAAYQTLQYRFDLYGAFIERFVVRWGAKRSKIGFIIPHTLLSNDSFVRLRALMAQRSTIDQVVDLGPGVFQGARNETMLLFATCVEPSASSTARVKVSSAGAFPASSEDFLVPQQEWAQPSGAAWLVGLTPGRANVLRQIAAHQNTLDHYCTINQGLRTGDNEKFLADSPRGPTWKRAAGGSEVERYAPLANGLFVLYDPDLLDAPRRQEIFDVPEKIVVQEIRNITLRRRIVATLDRDHVFCLQSTNVLNRRSNRQVSMVALLGLLNSSTVNWFFRISFSGNNHIASNQLARIPVPNLSPAVGASLEALVERRLSLASGPGPNRNAAIAAAEAQIDELVFDAYDLGEAERVVILEDEARGAG